jgi:molybdopterin synthase sulfur carrier subunit
MTITILFFGQLAELAGLKETELADIYSTTEVMDYMKYHYPSLLGLSFAIAVNKKITGQPVELNDGDIVALIPPFSGG